MARRNNKRPNQSRQTLFGEIEVSNHTIERYCERLQLELVEPKYLRNKSAQITRNEAIKRIKNELMYSKFQNFRGKDDLRIFRGNMYVVGKTKTGYKAITMLISNVTKKELFTERFDGEVDTERFLRPEKFKIA